MSKTQDFLIEIGTEELPPVSLFALSNTLANGIQQGLEQNNIDFDKNIQIFATPRRLAVLIPKVQLQQPEQVVSKRGPAINFAYDTDGTPTKAAQGFAESLGVSVKELTTQKTEKGEWLFFSQKVPGKNTIEIIPIIVEASLQQLPIKKRMRWGNGEFSFVRPIHWLLMLLGDTVVPATIFDIKSEAYTYGHRIHHPERIKIDEPRLYADKLEQEGFVIASFAKRQNIIRDEIIALAQRHGGIPTLGQPLLDTVTGLVEWPIALLANFNQEFLSIPKECLISAMEHHQKCFAIFDEKNPQQLLPKFILISNIQSTDPETIIHGNELVMNARLKDAQFHYKNDLKHSLESRVERLKNIVYQKKLGSIYDKVVRIEKLAVFIAQKLNADLSLVQRAAHLCKTDLVTDMVGEFPELQGLMGYYYALNDKESPEVATAIYEHYMPKTAHDELPHSICGITLALADRIDSLVGFFGIGLIPTGDKDPYGCRRQALAIIRILVEEKINLELEPTFMVALNNYPNELFTADIKQKTINELLNFFNERMKNWLAVDNIQPQIYNAVENVVPLHDPLDIFNRINAVISFQKNPEAIKLTAANKRVSNLLKTVENSDKITLDINTKLISEQDERNLFQEISKKEQEAAPLRAQKDYTQILQTLTTLQQPVDSFFDNVMVNAPDPNIKQNRIRLLKRLHNLFTEVADISLL